jgi:hypothetical protein
MELIEAKSLIWAQKGYKTGALKRKRQVKQSGNILK